MDIREEFRKYRAKGYHVGGFRQHLASLDRPAIEFDEDRSGWPRASFRRDEWDITIRTSPDECTYLSCLGELSREENPDGIKIRERGGVVGWFVPQITAAEHRKGLSAMGYSRGNAEEMARGYVRRDMKRFMSHGNDWNMMNVDVIVYRNGVALGTASLGGVDGGETRDDTFEQIADVAEDIISEAIGEAEKALADLCPCASKAQFQLSVSTDDSAESADKLASLLEFLAGNLRGEQIPDDGTVRVAGLIGTWTWRESR